MNMTDKAHVDLLATNTTSLFIPSLTRTYSTCHAREIVEILVAQFRQEILRLRSDDIQRRVERRHIREKDRPVFGHVRFQPLHTSRGLRGRTDEQKARRTKRAFSAREQRLAWARTH